VSTAKLLYYKGSDRAQEFPLSTEQAIAIGRHPDNDLVLEGTGISRFHGEIRHDGDQYSIVDRESSYGTYVNGERIRANEPRPLQDRDIIYLGDSFVQFCDQTNSEQTQYEPRQTPHPSPQPYQLLDLRQRDRIRIGRDPENEIVIDHPSVSRFHAEITRKDSRYLLQDRQSTNGTFINEEFLIRPQVLKIGDTIHIGPSRLVFNPDETLIENNEAGNLRLDAQHLTKIVDKNVKVLDDISLSLQPREFVVIAGVSGSGKSTLLDALNGSRPATKGEVQVNGSDLYTYFDTYRAQIGYVPQKDIIHPSLTVEQSLDYAARLRMPTDTTVVERRERVREVLDELSLSDRREVLVQNLSGGELKRVSMGVELLTKPSLFFLDEATSGLDPGTEGEIMNLLRELAHQGRIITLITHATENVILCDLVVFLAKGGRVAYFGPPQEAPAYFGVEQFNQIYALVEHERSPEELQADYQKSEYYQKYVRDRQEELEKSHPNRKYPGLTKLIAQNNRVSPWRQWQILLRRDFDLLRQDRASLWLTVLIAPVLGLLDLLIWSQDLFDPTTGEPRQALMMLFVATIIALMVGSLSSMREIVKERDIYRRERMVGLQLVPYILSKFSLGVVVALVQAAVFVLFKMIAIAFPGGGEVMAGIYLSLALATIGGVTLGLLVSAISPNQSVAPLLIVLVLIPQITLGGGLVPLQDLSSLGHFMSNLTLSRWTFESMVTVTGMGRDIAADECLKSQGIQAKNPERCPCSGAQLFDHCEVPGIRAQYHAAVAEEAPAEPKKPGEIPSNRQELMDYQAQVAQYQEEVAQWREEFEVWKEKRERAIGEGEGIARRLDEDYGEAFDVNLTQYWGILISAIAALIVAIILIQKRQDLI
jgi:ABC-type multidrug transport system ATPase subunit